MRRLRLRIQTMWEAEESTIVLVAVLTIWNPNCEGPVVNVNFKFEESSSAPRVTLLRPAHDCGQDTYYSEQRGAVVHG